MTNYSLSAYGSQNPNLGMPANGNTSAWGGYEWPNCPPASLQGTTNYASKYGQVLKVTVRKEIVELVTNLFKIADKHNYKIWSNNNGVNWGPWGGECRPISGTTRPSGHSKFLSIDCNAPNNPYSYSFLCDMPPPMVAEWEACGFYWGGRYKNQKYDPMHYGFCYAPGDVKRFLNISRSFLVGDEDDMTPDECRQVVRDELKKFFSTDVIRVSGDEMNTPSDYDSTRDKLAVRNNRLTSIGTATVTGRDGRAPVPPK